MWQLLREALIMGAYHHGPLVMGVHAWEYSVPVAGICICSRSGYCSGGMCLCKEESHLSRS